ncbi:unnamed protein product [Didymodactylos carnosus]|uniref:poly(ADP-ribose) glycohydrolase n=1 Tax=Didymodactylos carnosus TaxID=1234261 RepID=A0A814V9V0_9BILA|nr:unnamed protein product [Didymodactylos carnosus]CAF3949589.1 unnamed protein product [Didymodactylos carnosus]
MSVCEELFLPSHPSLIIEDRLSLCGNEEDSVLKWKFITHLLTTRHQSNQTPASIVELISCFCPNLSCLSTTVLYEVLNENLQFCSYYWPNLVNLALKLPTLFPTHTIRSLDFTDNDEEEIKLYSLTREQIACLLVHMFLCTIDDKNFSLWYESSCYNPSKSYLTVLIYYFQYYVDFIRDNDNSRSILFERHRLQRNVDWKLCKKPLIKQLYQQDDLNDILSTNLQLIFANKHIGYGQYGTQEEAHCGMSTELNVVVLFMNRDLRDNECLVVHGIQTFGQYQGYGNDLKLIGFHSSTACDWSRRSYVFADALEMNFSETNELEDLKEYNLTRELAKISCTFRLQQDKSLNTGHFGCGAFHGNRYVKIVLQILVASFYNVQLHFYSSSKAFIDEINDLLKYLNEKQINCSDLYHYLEYLKVHLKHRTSKSIPELVKWIAGNEKV